MRATYIPPTDDQIAENDTYGGGIQVGVSVGLDTADSPLIPLTSHDLARLLLQCAPTPLTYR